MPLSSHTPGFRLSVSDIAVLIVGVIATVYLWQKIAWWAGLMIAFPVGHFFLFCNVFRIPRKPELIWASTFVILTSLTLLTEFPGWALTFVTSLAVSTLLVLRQLFQPGYHGVFWKTFNPGMTGWTPRSNPEVTREQRSV